MTFSSAGPVVFRDMREGELAAIETIHASAFGSDDEAQLPQAIIRDGHEILSVVAAKGDYLVGHALFSALRGAERALALAPVAVVPDHQGEGIGSHLIRYGLARAKEEGWRSVFVLGDPAFYGPLGFDQRTARGATVPWSGPNFQALELVPGSLEGWTGILLYPEAFGGEDVV